MKSKVFLLCVLLSALQNINAQWNEMGLLNKDVRNVMVEDTVIYACIAEQGLMKSTNNGATWNPMNNGIQEAQPTVTGIARTPLGLYITSYDTVYYSSDNAASWTAIHGHNLGANYQYRNIESHGNTLFIQFHETLNGISGFERSLDGGVTWYFHNWINSISIQNDHIYFADNSNLYVSTDDCQTTSLQSNDYLKFNLVYAADTQTIYRHTSNNGYPYVSKSSDYGVTWDSLCAGPYFFLDDMVEWNSEILANSYVGVYLSYGSVSSWADMNYNLPTASFSIRKSRLHNDYVYVCSNKGLYVMNLNQVVGITELEKTGEMFSLAPNPTSSTTQLTVNNAGQEYEVRIYNLEGTLMREFRTSDEQLSIDLSNYEQGMYTLQVLNGEHSETKKIVKL